MSNKKTYSIFGAGAAGLYTAWRLLEGTPADKAGKQKQLKAGDVLELYDWGKYDYSAENPGTRAPGARVCTWHYMGNPENSYLELGGMRYSNWNFQDCAAAPGHRVVTKVIDMLGLTPDSVPFNESINPLYCLRAKNMYLNDINSNQPAPYDVNNYGASTSPNNGFSIVQNLATTSKYPSSREEWCKFYEHGAIKDDMPESSIYKKGDKLKDIGYWNLMYDQLGSEGFNYTADGNGYTSNIINWNSADAFQANNEFTPGNTYNTLKHGYSSMFKALFNATVKLAKEKKVKFEYHPDTRLHSILQVEKDGGKTIQYTFASRANPDKSEGIRYSDAAWLAMPRYALDLVAQATRYTEHKGLDVLNQKKTQLFLESAIMQPSFKVGMFFSCPWWETATYAPQTEGYVVTTDVLAALHKAGFPEAYINLIRANTAPLPCPPQPDPVCPSTTTYIMYNQYASAPALIADVVQCVGERLTVAQENILTTAARRNTIGPSITDMPMRMCVYFGNNALNQNQPPVYGILSTYDDEQYTPFWQELELGPGEVRHVPESRDYQPLEGPRRPNEVMVKMLRKQLASMHFGPGADYTMVPAPLDTQYMDWSLPPFNAGYHAWGSHVNICEVQQGIRKPSQLIPGADADIFIVGETYSNDQAWVEGAYCTAESVLNDFFHVKPIIDPTHYPFICRGNC